ncbi:MAG: RpiB/LacA/LacB family sugar-phosphate isomerase [Cyanobacteria bacterium SBLK]|nr:RpiB/LacA/LacB family sugar-phosphate isomerase [Cyanobacteria bacterium SBLK]
MKIVIGADFYGFPLKEVVKEYLLQNDYEVRDYGVNNTEDTTPYYNIAEEVVRELVNREYDRGILVCGTGMGMSIVANKHAGIYAAVCESPFAAEKSRSINNSNILTLGSMVTTNAVAKDIVKVWLDTEFTEGWDASIQEWLRNSMNDISSLEREQFTKK